MLHALFMECHLTYVNVKRVSSGELESEEGSSQQLFGCMSRSLKSQGGKVYKDKT